MGTLNRRLVWAGAWVVGASLLVATGCGSPAGDNAWAGHTQGLPFVMGYEQGTARAQAENRPAMYFVTTTWCGWCKRLADENFNDPGVRELLDQFTLVLVDGDSEAAAARQLGAKGFPHVVFKSSEGETLEVVQSYLPVDDFKPIVERALAHGRG